MRYAPLERGRRSVWSVRQFPTSRYLLTRPVTIDFLVQYDSVQSLNQQNFIHSESLKAVVTMALDKQCHLVNGEVRYWQVCTPLPPSVRWRIVHQVQIFASGNHWQMLAYWKTNHTQRLPGLGFNSAACVVHWFCVSPVELKYMK